MHTFLSVFSHPSSSQSELIRLQLTFAGSASTGFRYVFICLSVAFSCAAAFLRFPAFPLFRLSPLNVCLPCVNEVVAQRRPNNFSAKIFLQLAAKWYERKKLADKGELKIKAISLLITQQMAWQNEYFLSNSQDLPLLLAIVSFIMNESMELNWNNNYACK